MDIVSVILLILVVVVGFVWWHYHGTANMPPRISLLEFILNIMLVRFYHETMYSAHAKLGEKYNGIHFFRFLGLNFVVITDWRIMKEALNGQSEVFAGRPEMYVATTMLQHNDILFIDGPILKEKRRFTLHHLRSLGFGKTSMENVIFDEIARFSDTLDKKLGQKLQGDELFFLPILNVLWKVIAGKQYEYNDKEIQQVGHNVKSIFEFFGEAIYLNFYPYLRFLPPNGSKLKTVLKLTEIMKSFLNKEIDEHLTSLVVGEPRDFIDSYLTEIIKQKSENVAKNTSNCYTREHLIGTAFDLLQAGIETTVSTLEWTIAYMVLWPNVQTKIQKELDTVIGRNRLPTYADRSLLPYLEATIQEIHRLSSVVPLSGPHSTKKATTLAGYTIPKNTVIIQNIFAVHYNKKLWGDPEVFRPERFINEDGKVERPEYLIPFSIGARKCIGESLARIEVFMMVSCLLQRYSFSRAKDESLPKLNSMKSLTRPPPTFYLTVTKRSE